MVSLSDTRPRPPVVRNNREIWLFLETAWLRTDCVYPPAKKIELEKGNGGKEIVCWVYSDGGRGHSSSEGVV